MGRLQNKVAIITGADGGICGCASRLFAQEGAKVVMVDKCADVEQKAADIRANGGEAIALVLDVAKKESWDEILKKTIDTYGTVDCCVNGAAEFTLTGDWNTPGMSMEEWDLVLDTNLKSMLWSFQTVLQYMIDHEIKGNFINFASATALSFNGGSCQAYPMSKAAIKITTSNMAASCGKYGIRFNMLAPNSVKVPKMVAAGVYEKYGDFLKSIIPLDVLGEPEDAAWAMVYFASDEAKYISGVCMQIDGGWSTCH